MLAACPGWFVLTPASHAIERIEFVRILTAVGDRLKLGVIRNMIGRPALRQ